ncbi:MAG: hypothetical protein FWC73_14495 [Defluviitaleaceae bacterium]|nr:hypothetical protein [Defluviitaleaceae bacterium]
MKKITVLSAVMMFVLFLAACGMTNRFVVIETELERISYIQSLAPTQTPIPAFTPQPRVSVPDHYPESAYYCTDEQYINEYYIEAIVDFLVVNYPQIFMRTLVSEDTDGGRAGFRHGSWHMLDFYRDRPVIAVTFHDAGSWTGPAYYFFVDGKYRRVRDLPPDLSRLIPTRPLGDGFHEQITEAVNQRLWPMLTLRADGLIVDGNLSDALVDIVKNFVMGLQHVQTIDVIKASLIQDDLVSVAVTCTDGFRRYHWVLLDKVDGVYDVYSHCDEYLWWGNR